LLRELKRRGYHIVHVVPVMADRPKTATVPSQWIMSNPELAGHSAGDRLVFDEDDKNFNVE
jgi:hypothetical protein